MTKAKRKALGSDPLVIAGLVPDEPKTKKATKAKKRGPIAADGRTCPVAFRIDYDLVEELRAAAFWTKTTISEIVETALRAHLEKLHAKNGGPFPRP